MINQNFFNPQVTLKFPGTVVHNAIGPAAWTDLDLSAVVGSRKALVVIRSLNGSGGNSHIYSRTNGDTLNKTDGISIVLSQLSGRDDLLVVYTDASGIIEWYVSNVAGTHTLTVEAFIA